MVDTPAVWPIIQVLGNQDIHKAYEFENQEIGSGHYGVVRKAKLKSVPSKVFAVKSIPKKKLKGDIGLLRGELDMLRCTDHPNIIQFYEIFQDEECFHFVMEYCEGGDITTLIEKNGPCTEQRAKEIIFDTLLAISHLHSTGIIHRDIKPDNFLFKNTLANSPVKLIDFGLSKRTPPSGKLRTVLGTPYYVAPEILERKGYDKKVDVWSAGVMMYLILAADFPFRGETQALTFEKIKRARYNMEASEPLRTLSPEGKKFLGRLLEKDPNHRYTATEALRDPWFDELNIEFNERGRKQITKTLLDRLRSFKSESRFTKEVIRMMVMIHDEDPEVLKLRDAFFYIDALNSGILVGEEIKKVFKELGEEITDEEVYDITESLELRVKNILTYTEFITATIDEKFIRNEKNLSEMFNRFDINGDQFITMDDMVNCFTRFGLEIPRSEIVSMINENDINKDHKISFQEFKLALSKNLHEGSMSPPN
jgi:calcium-dependent protein kinase